MGTRKRIETGSDIWEAALAEPPIEKTKWMNAVDRYGNYVAWEVSIDSEPEHVTVSELTFFLLAAVGSVATLCGVAGLISWLFF